jgi:Tol biopolymer transport system component
MEKEVKPADLDALKAVGTKANGLVVWTSSRAGTPHIFSMRTDGSDTKQLTKGGTTDFRPRFSPDGAAILFQRSRAADFVRESDASLPGTWDLYTMSVDGADVTKVADDATWGSWAGPGEIVFLRGAKVMRKRIGGEAESRVIDTSRYPVFEGATIRQPELSHDGHFVALTLGGARRQVGIFNIKKRSWTPMGEGAQIAWAPDGASVYWIDDSGKEESRVAREPIVAGTPADEHDPDKIGLVDLPGKRSREQFPSLSSDGKWLVFAAAVGTLENDLEDFELFLWETGSPPTAAARLTFHSANDRWPDLFVGAQPAPAAEPAKEPAEKKAEPADEGAETKPAETKPAETSEPEGAKAEPAPTKETAPPAATEEAPDEGAAPAAAPAKPKGKKKKHR